MSVTPVFCELKVSSNCLHSNITKRKNPYLRVVVSVLTKGFHVTILPFGGSCVLFVFCFCVVVSYFILFCPVSLCYALYLLFVNVLY